VAVVGVLLFASAVGNGTKTDAPTTTTSAAGATTSPATPAATSTAPTSTPPTSAVPVAEPALAPVVAPTRRTATRITTAPAAARTTTPEPVPPEPPATKPTRTATAPAPAGSRCDANYSGCVPVAKDVDCEGGSGDGPAYVRGPVNVLGKDVYGLDSDKDGVGCE
jgi:hypothetical protein